MKINLSKIISSTLFLVLSSTAIQAQPKLLKLDKLTEDNFKAGDFVIFSDVENPEIQGNHNKLVSIKNPNLKDPYFKYHFEDTNSELWFKYTDLFCIEKSIVHTDKEIKNLYNFQDFYKNLFIQYPSRIGDEQYISLIHSLDQYNFYSHSTATSSYIHYFDKKNNFVMGISKEEDGYNYIKFVSNEQNALKIPYIYKFENLDHVTEKIYDYNVKSGENYILIERKYKLNETYNTMVFPTDVTLLDRNHYYGNGKYKMIVYRLDEINGTHISFIRDDSNVMKANTPYIIKGQANDNTDNTYTHTELYITDTPVDIKTDINNQKKIAESESGSIKIGANYSYSVSLKSNKYNFYMMHDNKLIKCSNVKGNPSLKRYRWYVQNDAASHTPITLSIQDGSTTDIMVVNEDEVNTNDNQVYTLSGEKLGVIKDTSILPKGYYVVNGRVVLLGK